jgi:crotonobetainyl-CoA:carnitine CoA-transferase CaiB-like acyl-CoA transferase
VFRTATEEIVVAVGNDDQWRRFCEALERPDLRDDPRWARMTLRITGREELVPDLARTLVQRPALEWLSRIESAGVPCGRINDYAQVFQEPQVVHRGLRVDVPRDDGAKVGTTASPLRLSATPPRYERAPPRLGEATEELLQRVLGKGAAQLETLRRDGVI